MVATSLDIPHLVIQAGDSREQFELRSGSKLALGRHPSNEILLSDRCASRQHAQLVSLQNHHCCYVDLNSRNGSRIKGQSITTPILLQHDDRIRIGDTRLIFQDIPAHRSTAAAPNSQGQVLLLQADALQGKIWQSILRSQKIDSFWESADIDLKDYLPRRAAAATLPQLLILDTQLLGEEIYDLCAWCCQTYPQMKIIVTNSQERQILMPERQKASQAGCLNWFPAFREPKLLDSVAGIVVQVTGVMKTLGEDHLRQDQLFAALKSFEELLVEMASLAPSPRPTQLSNSSQTLESSRNAADLLDSTQISSKR